ncbi:Putative zn(2)-C6 fungal-type DNA-binding domain-containing protein [Septoria linicola]|uniref:Zn(2)-C6 fungal-type DNA-binding domain-containing protein n=1 Tax=Septoria linicola TaxID=215465 RepID=A0A9Q9AWW0_9PEZI|nr:Putative zn(2)-C6 fungal-type DNA-binding domain-containing protein [Septoria linicola]
MEKQKGSGAKRAQVANACRTCRAAKLKCSSEHPECSRCIDRGLVCQYDAAEGVTKRRQIRNDLMDRTDELERATSVLSNLKHGSDHEAASSLAHLRMGASIESEDLRIQANRQSAGPTSPSSSATRQPATSGELEAQNLAMQNERLRRLLHPTQQPDPRLAQTQNPSAASTYTYQDPDGEAQSWNNIDPQILDGVDPSSQEGSRNQNR